MNNTNPIQERQECCPKCGRNFKIVDGVFPKHRVLKNQHSPVICKGSEQPPKN